MNKVHQCPRCNVPLQSDTVKDMYFSNVSIESCPSCKGQWLQSDQLEFLAKEYDVVLLEFRKIPPLKEQLKALTCPSCGINQPMDKVEHERDAKVILDSCPKCNGVWLDKGELDAIQKESIFALAGKLYKWSVSEK